MRAIMINRKTIFAAVFIFAFTAFTPVFAQTDEDSVQPPKKAKAKGKSSDAEPPADSETGAVKKDETVFKVGGLVETGLDINKKVNRASRGDETGTKIIGRGELEISARPVKKVRAELGVKYNYKRDTTISAGLATFKQPNAFIVIDKLYGQYNFWDFGGARVGLMKKSFGPEERAGVDERCFHKRSIINDKLEEYGFLDHDLTLQYRHEIGKEWRFTGGVSWSVVDSLRYLQNYSAQYNAMENLTFILAGIIRHYDIPADISKISGVEGVAVTSVWSLSAVYELPFLVSEAEITFGTNPQIKIEQNNRDALILGARLQERFPISVETKILRQIVPVAEAALYWDDFEGGVFDTQLRAGLVLGFAKNSAFQFRNTVGTVLRTQNDKTDVRRYRYDSEVVVIF
jgi:hypothetical protein